MRLLRASCACLCLLCLVVAGGCTETPPERTDAGSEPDLTCPPSPTGGLLVDGVEADPGYDDELAALDLDALPATLALDGLSTLERDLVLFMLEEESLDAVDRDAARAAGPLGDAVLAALARAPAPDGIDLSFLRRGLHRFYACARGFPPTLDEFLAEIYDFRADPVDEVIDSDVKRLERRITRSGIFGGFVAETLRADGSVRETEIILTDRRTDGDLEFLEYDEGGQLRSASEFAAANGGEVIGAVPFACIACHGFRDVVPAQ